MQDPDYIIVGAGSAGAGLAYQLAKDRRRKVLLLEAGPSHRHPFVSMPKGLGKILASERHTWRYAIDNEASDAPEHWLRGRLLGGSSAINGMMYFRGQKADYDDWAAAGATGWDGLEMLRVFREMEDHESGGADGRGMNGPLKISIPESGDLLTEGFIEAGVQMGVPRVHDLNNPELCGVGYAPQTIGRGVRSSSAHAFLDQIKNYSNIRIVNGFEADRVIFKDLRACGVVGSLNGSRAEFRTEGEVILAAGALNSPAILQRSGIGNPDLLAPLGIELLAANREVGEHLLEHRTLFLNYDLIDRLGENHEYRGVRLFANTLRYAIMRDGPMASPPYPAAGFFHTRPGLDRPDAEIIFAPYVMRMLETGNATETQPSCQVFSFPCRSRSRGTVRITSSDPAAAPSIRPNYLSDPYDQEVTVGAYRFTVEWMRKPAISRMIARERDPLLQIQTDDEIIDFYKRQGGSTFHSCGTCRMGGTPDAVVDARLQVRGVYGLRVADASIMPTMPSCNTNGPCLAIGWRAGEIITERNQQF